MLVGVSTDMLSSERKEEKLQVDYSQVLFLFALTVLAVSFHKQILGEYLMVM